MLKVLQIAQAEVGTRESGNNGTLYARDLDAIHYFNTPKQNLADLVGLYVEVADA